jgi:hypothetical protein
MKKTRIFPVLLLVAVFLTSCEWMWWINPGPPEPDNLFLTGECLGSTELIYIPYYASRDDDYLEEWKCFPFVFHLDTANVQRYKERPLFKSDPAFHIPSDELFKSFGKKSFVKSDFFDSFDKIREGRSYFEITTLLYNGGLSLTADVDFAGHPAGEELAPFIVSHPSVNHPSSWTGVCSTIEPLLSAPGNTKEKLSPILDIPLDYECLLESGIEIGLPVGDYTRVVERVTFTLKIPVRVVYYLQWLEDKHSNPNAPVPYKDEVLTCKFYTDIGFR